MASDYTVGDLVAEFLSQCGVTTAFGIASVHNIPMLDAIQAQRHPLHDGARRIGWRAYGGRLCPRLRRAWP